MKYTLIGLTWILILCANVYLWIKDDTNPNVWLWIILAVLSVIPLAGRLKIGSWFDFRKRDNNVGQEMATTQERITNIGNLNIQLQGEEAARAFVERLIPYSEPERLDETEELTKADKEAITFIYNVDKAIASLLPLLRVLYIIITSALSGLKLGSQEWKEKSFPILDKDILFLMQEIKEHAPKVFTFKDSEKKFVELFEPVEKLIKLRSAIDEKDAKPPTEEEAKALVEKVYYAGGFLSGMFAVGMSILFVRDG